MSNRVSFLIPVLRSPGRILAMVLAVIFTVEVGVMLLVPVILPAGTDAATVALMDALWLTFLSAPALWWVIIGPLRQIAIREYDRSETIVANAGEGILTFDCRGKVISANRAASILLGTTGTRLVGRSVLEMVPRMPLSPGASPTEIRDSAVRSDGTRIPVQVSISALPSSADNLLIAIVRDMTEAERSEQHRIASVRQREAMRAQQMATLAELATGVAHEIRNPLTSIKMLIQVNREMFARNGLPTDDMVLVEEEIRRMERSISGLLDYARPAEARRQRFLLQDAIAKTLRLVEGRCVQQGVRVKFVAPDPPLTVVGDSSQMQQLVLNLCLNALDAMPSGGDLAVDLKVVNREAELAVTDTGTGIDGSVLEKLFSPFVTTKPHGAGLGLGICRRIAEAHGGRLAGSNVRGSGARFELRLPLSEQDSSSESARSRQVA